MSKDPGSRHLSAAAVMDTGRGVLSLTPGTSGSSHLDSCPECPGKLNTWKEFLQVARRLREADPPEEVVRRATALTSRRPPVTGLIRLRATLHYHSGGIPPPAGMRGASLTDQDQVVYHAEGFAVDLRVSRTRSRQVVVVVGQITSLEQPAKRLGGVSVLLTADQRVVVRAVSNAWGEFYLETGELDHMWLEVAPTKEQSIRIPLRPRPKTQTI